MLEIKESRLDKLRQQILKTLAAEPALDSSRLQRQLCGHGFSDDVAWLLSRSVLMHGAFGKPDVPLDEVRAVWEDVYALLSRDALGSDITAAQGQLGKDMTNTTFERVAALRIQQQTSHSAGEGPEDGPAPDLPADE